MTAFLIGHLKAERNAAAHICSLALYLPKQKIRSNTMQALKLPIGNDIFKKLREDGAYYVDKTGFIEA